MVDWWLLGGNGDIGLIFHVGLDFMGKRASQIYQTHIISDITPIMLFVPSGLCVFTLNLLSAARDNSNKKQTKNKQRKIQMNNKNETRVVQKNTMYIAQGGLRVQPKNPTWSKYREPNKKPRQLLDFHLNIVVKWFELKKNKTWQNFCLCRQKKIAYTWNDKYIHSANILWVSKRPSKFFFGHPISPTKSPVISHGTFRHRKKI